LFSNSFFLLFCSNDKQHVDSSFFCKHGLRMVLTSSSCNQGINNFDSRQVPKLLTISEQLITLTYLIQIHYHLLKEFIFSKCSRSYKLSLLLNFFWSKLNKYAKDNDIYGQLANGTPCGAKSFINC